MIMSKYTTELRYLLQSGLILFDFDYPCPSQDKPRLESNIINHYYFYEIGSETWARFKINFMSSMQSNMPYFNKLYETFNNLDPSIDYNMTSTFESNIGGISKAIFNDTPASSLQNQDYATNITTSNSNSNSNSKSNTSGYKTNLIDKILKFKMDKFAIDNLVINSLAECFMLVF